MIDKAIPHPAAMVIRNLPGARIRGIGSRLPGGHSRGTYGYWNEVTSTGVMNRAGREVMNVARDFEMRDGFTKRVMLDTGGVAIMMVAGLALTRTPQARRRSGWRSMSSPMKARGC